MTTTSRPRPVQAGRGRPLRAIPEDASAGDVTQIWAEQQFARLGVTETPEYGSPAWVKLRAEDPQKAAAVIEAAELWRRTQARERWLDQLVEDDPERWFALVTSDATAEARRALRYLRLSSQPTAAQVAERRAKYGPIHQLKATSGWPPIAVPGKPGHYLTYGQENPA